MNLSIEERRLRRLEKRICHLTALARLTAILGGHSHERVKARVRELLIRENRRLLEMLQTEDPEEMAKRPAREPGESAMEKQANEARGNLFAGKEPGNRQGTGRAACGFSVDK